MRRPVGVLGGLGPKATAYFLDRVADLTEARTDQEHLDVLVWGQASTPDRTAFLVGASDEDPLPAMTAAARALEAAGAEFVVMPCNTAHHFHEALAGSVGIPFLDIVEVTVELALARVPGLRRLGVLATEGTIRSGIYARSCERHGLRALAPDDQVQAEVSDIIYAGVKAGRPVDPARFRAVLEHLRGRGCEAIALGCTELSMLVRDLHVRDPDVVDSIDALARATVRTAGKRVREPAD